MDFEWDESKNRSNEIKHGLNFSEVTEIFTNDQEYLEIYDATHSDDEDRFLAIGEIKRGISVVVFTEREGDVIRIIGARFATKYEQEQFRDFRRNFL